MVRTQSFHCWASGSIRGQVTKIWQAMGHGQKKSFGTVNLCVVEPPVGYPSKFFCFILFLVLRDLFFPI